MSGALRVIEQVPKVDDFTSLETHQQETPNTFYGAKAVLHHRVANASLKVSERELTTNSALRALRTSAGPGAAPHASPGAHSNGDGVVPRVEVTITRIQIWVTSDFFVLWSSNAGTGVQIPYRTISLHARQQHSLYMQLCLSDISQTADDDLETIEMLLTPEPSPDSDATEASEQLFNAVSACADLHPDPDEDDDQEQEPMPGAGGWITSDNMDQFVDENGDFRMPRGSSLGVGAGTVRTADQFEDANNDYDDEDDDDDDDNDDDNHDVDNGADGEETKWRRTS